MQLQIRVQLLHGEGEIVGVTFDGDIESIRANVEQVMGAEGKGALVIEDDQGGYAIIPTRNIAVVMMVPRHEETQ